MGSAPRGDDVQHVADEHAPRPAAGPATDVGEAEGSGEQASVDVMRLLSQHVPLTLLADLAQPTGPDSPDILEDEGLPSVAWWESVAEEKR